MAKFVEFTFDIGIETGDDTKILKYNTLPCKADLDEDGRELLEDYIDSYSYLLYDDDYDEDLFVENASFSYTILDEIGEWDEYEERD